MSDLLSLGMQGIRAYTAGLATVSDNIANAQTAGFTRRNVMLAENIPLRPDPLHPGLVSPQGSRIAGIGRAVDSWLIDESRLATGGAASAEAKARWMAAAEAALGDPASDTGVTMTALFNIADQLTADPGNLQRRGQFVRALGDIAQSLNRTADGLQRASAGVVAEARTTVGDLNRDLAGLQSVNASLARARPGSSAQASLLDERDRHLDRITSALDIAVQYDARGAASISLAGSGETLLNGTVRNGIAVTVGADGRIAYSVNPGSGAPVLPRSGALAGLSEAASDIADRIANLDTLANGFATSLNQAHAAGFDQNGAAGAPLFALSGTAQSMRSLLQDPAQVAAADATSANGNMLAFAALRGPGGGEAQWRDFTSAQSLATARAQAASTVAAGLRDAAAAARADQSSVDLDREAAELLRFQQAYQGAARVLQVARETMQSILAI